MVYERISQHEAQIRVSLKREIRRLLGVGIFEGIRYLPTEQLEEMRDKLLRRENEL